MNLWKSDRNKLILIAEIDKFVEYGLGSGVWYPRAALSPRLPPWRPQDGHRSRKRTATTCS